MAKTNEVELDLSEAFDVDEGAEGIFGLLESDSILLEDESGEIEDDAGEDDEESSAESESDDEPDEDEPDEDEDEDESDDEDDEEPEDEAEDSDEPPTYKVKVDGEEIEVTLDEALAGYQRQTAFTRKTQDVARQKEENRGVREELRAERQVYGERLQQVDALFAQIMPKEPDWTAVEAENPKEYPKIFQAYHARKKIVDAVQAESARVAEEAEADWETERAELLENEQEKLLDVLPEWEDSSKRASELAEMMAYAETQGYTAEEVESVTDHRNVVLLRKSMLYDKLVSGGEKVKKAAKPKKTPTLKPGVAGTRKATKASEKRKAARKRLAKSGSVDDAAEAIFNVISE